MLALFNFSGEIIEYSVCKREKFIQGEITMEYYNYMQKLNEISKSWSELPDYTQSSELKKVVENTSKIALVLENVAHEIIQNEAMQAFSRIAERFNNIKYPIVSKDVIQGFETYHDLEKLENIQWPLYFVYNDEIMRRLSSFSSISEENEEEIRDIVFQFCTLEFIQSLFEDWEKSSVIDRRRLPILKEAITMFNAGLYFGCVSTLSCQLCGIITDTYEMQKQYGRQVNMQNLEDIYVYFNPQVTHPSIKVDREKTQLLWFITEVEGGIVYWIKAIKYIYNIILTSKDYMKESAHPCRNKICHGIQINFGTKEHALKSVLTIDMMIRIAENLKFMDESRRNC